MKQSKSKDSFSKLDKTERDRLKALTKYEQQVRAKGFQSIVGLDEAGRGPLAGPLVAGACLIPEGVYIPYINDSKKLEPKLRHEIFLTLTSDPRIVYGIGIIDHTEIDKINIYQATIKAMLSAISQLAIVPDHLLIDGLSLPHPTIPCTKIIKGDSLSQSIAGASILAKETRDHLMRQYHLQWPQYGFDQHKGYGTEQHLEAIQKYGPCEIHRKSFAPFKNEACPILVEIAT